MGATGHREAWPVNVPGPGSTSQSHASVRAGIEAKQTCYRKVVGRPGLSSSILARARQTLHRKRSA